MVIGDTGHNGLPAPRHVDLETEAGQETVTSQLQLMEEETVRGQARSLELVTQIPVQVTNNCLTPFDICNTYCLS